MWTLSLPDVTDVDAQLTKALTYATGKSIYTLSTTERKAILAVYQAYDTLLGCPNPNLTPKQLTMCREHIRDAYNQVQSRGRLAALRASLLASTDACPYCGFGEPTELDHYLPKSIYNELAIYPRNLVPSCSFCNHKKGKIVPGDSLGPGFIHAYFQKLPCIVFMRADANFTNGALEVTFRIDPAGLKPSLAAMLKFQLCRLDLNDRYSRQINTFLFEQRAAILSYKAKGVPSSDLAAFFCHSAKLLAENFGSNDWRPALMKALAADKSFCATPEAYLGMR